MAHQISFHRRLALRPMILWVMVVVGLRGTAADLPPTFNREIAPILYQHCTPCHRPGAAGPFPLLQYSDAQPRARKLAEAVSNRDMPPWMPEVGHGDFLGARRLSEAQIQAIRSWADQGAPEGDPKERPKPPEFPSDWEWGPPDLVLTLPERYDLEATGKDVYRNFVIPVPAGSNRYVRAFQFRPESPAVHHARILFDASGESRRRDAADPVCGFGGTMPPAHFPPGQMLGWVPGRTATLAPDGMTWPLDGAGDLVVQLHLQRTGRPESIQPRLGLYLTNRPPSQSPVLLGILAQTLDIPAGDSNYTVLRNVTLPVPADLLAVMPHAHYLAREVELTATPPGGAPQSLLRIRRWKFNWQDEYRYAHPVPLPAGTQLELRITYDNSAGNPANPNHPPVRVLHGPDSTDEMGELWLQLLPRDAAGFAALRQLHRELGQREVVADFNLRIQRDPGNAAYHLELGKTLGALGQQREAFEQLTRAVELNPQLAEAHQFIGISFLERRLLPDARAALEQALALDPSLYRSHLALGVVAAAEGNLEEAEEQLQQAAALNPGDEGIRRQLQAVRKRKAGR
ncbi:MAG: tetratricopeptide repeat protein [Verrucomicrobiota bacterium]